MCHFNYGANQYQIDEGFISKGRFIDNIAANVECEGNTKGAKKMKTAKEINKQKLFDGVNNLVGATMDLEWQVHGKEGKPGTFTIMKFTPDYSNDFEYWTSRVEKLSQPSCLDLGIVTVRFNDTKFYNGREIDFKVCVFFGEQSQDYAIMPYRLLSHKKMKAYDFPYILQEAY